MYQEGINFDITQAGGLNSMLFGGEGLFLATLSGTDKVWLQSMPISKLIRAIAPGGENTNKEGGKSILSRILEQ